MKLEELYREIQPRIYAYFYAKTGMKEAAEDLTHETFYQAMKNHASFGERSSLSTWLFAIAVNVLRKEYRSRRYRRQLAARIEPQEAERRALTTEQQVLQREQQRLLLDKINSLEENAKEIVILRAYGELSFKEIGELIGQSENYARVTFHRAKLKLHKELEGYYGS